MVRYDEYLADGLPIASGVVEGACRHLLQDRLDLSGATWTVRNAEAVGSATFRSLFPVAFPSTSTI